LVAFDSDADSLREIRRCYGAQGVETAAGTVRRIVAGKLQLGPFDLIYATGIYNYLEQQVGQRLTENLFPVAASRRPVADLEFLDRVRERGYMESFMDWHQIYRSPDQIQDLADGIDPKAVRDRRLAIGDGEEYQNIGILHVVKA